VIAFVTGATGFLGKRVVSRLLERGDAVRALVRDPSKADALAEAGAEVVIGDLADIDAFRDRLHGCDALYHIGARVLSHGDWDEFAEANIVATAKLIDYSLEAGCRRVVHVSSIGIFEIPTDGVTVSEETDYDHHPLLRGFYTRSKIDADRVARAAQSTGKPVVIVRPGQLYGADAPEPLFMGRVNKRIGPALIVVGTPGYYAPLVYVENAADAVVAAGTTEGIEGRIFNVVDDTDLSQREYFKVISGLPGYPRFVIYLPVALFMPFVSVVDRLFRLLKRRGWSPAYQLGRSGRNARYSTDVARNVLGWKPRLAWQEAVRETAAAVSR
jgi:nucleoside-diphosphate-sugar epimerase